MIAVGFLPILLASSACLMTMQDYCRNPPGLSGVLYCRMTKSGDTKAARPRPLSPAKLQSLRDDAEEGDPEAQFQLGDQLFAKDRSESWRWFCLAAEQGHQQGRVALGAFREFGFDPIEPDLTEAMKWYILAGESGQRFRRGLQDEISTIQLTEARRRAEVWTPDGCENTVAAGRHGNAWSGTLPT